MIRFFMYDNELFDMLDRIMGAYDSGIFEGNVAPGKEKLRSLYNDIVDILKNKRGCDYVKSFDVIRHDRLRPFIEEHGIDAVFEVVQEKFTLSKKCDPDR